MDSNNIRSSSNIRMFDSDIQTGLQLWSYTQCDDSTPFDVKQCRGVVLDGDKIVSRMFGYTPEVLDNEDDKIRSLLSPHDGKMLAVPAIEGTIIRLFKARDRWFLSTFRKLDAYNSRWGSQYTFGESFQKALLAEYETNPSMKEQIGTIETDSDLFDRFCSILNPDYTYTFILQTTSENRQVCKGIDPQIMWFMGVFDKDGVFHNKHNSFSMPVRSVASLGDSIQDATVDGVFRLLSNISILEYQGVIVYLPDNTQVKITNYAYSVYQKIRGNTPSVLSRYMEIYGDEAMKTQLRNMYPERSQEFQRLDGNVRAAAVFLHRTYIGRYVNKKYIYVHPLFNYLLKELHTAYINTREKVTLDTVLDLIKKQPARTISQVDHAISSL
jgi:hypothetical protein